MYFWWCKLEGLGGGGESPGAGSPVHINPWIFIPSLPPPLPTLHPPLYLSTSSCCNSSSRFPHKIITLPLDLSTLTPQQLADREKEKQAATSRVYVEEDIDDDEWEQDRYKHLLK